MTCVLSSTIANNVINLRKVWAIIDKQLSFAIWSTVVNNNNHYMLILSILQALDCPYTEGADESWVVELLFKPGEHRIQMLQWLFTK